MTDNAGYRPTDDSALRWEDTHCTKCGEPDKKCKCVARPERLIPSNERLRILLRRAQAYIYAGPPRNPDHDRESSLSADIRAELDGNTPETTPAPKPMDHVEELRYVAAMDRCAWDYARALMRSSADKIEQLLKSHPAETGWIEWKASGGCGCHGLSPSEVMIPRLCIHNHNCNTLKAAAAQVTSNWNTSRVCNGWDCWTCGAFVTHKMDAAAVERDCLKCGPNAVNGAGV